VWSVSGTYGDVVLQYCHFFKNQYGSDVIIVCDVYDTGASVKKLEHVMRVQKNTSALDIVLSDKSLSTKNQVQFLSNDKNKKSFIRLLTDYLTRSGYKVKQAVIEEDTHSIDTAVKATTERPVTVVATDTDVFIGIVFRIDVHL